MRGAGGLEHIAPRTCAREDESRRVEAFQGRAVGGKAGGLGDHRLTPAEAKPCEVLAHRIDELRSAAVAVQIIVAQQQLAAGLPGPLCRQPERARMPEVKQTCGRGREASAVGWARCVHNDRLGAKNALAVRKSSRDVPRPALVG